MSLQAYVAPMTQLHPIAQTSNAKALKMVQNRTNQHALRRSLAFAFSGLLLCLPVVLSGCNKDTSTSKTTTSKTTQTPEGTKQTTETNEKTVEVEKKR